MQYDNLKKLHNMCRLILCSLLFTGLGMCYFKSSGCYFKTIFVLLKYLKSTVESTTFALLSFCRYFRSYFCGILHYLVRATAIAPGNDDDPRLGYS